MRGRGRRRQGVYLLLAEVRVSGSDGGTRPPTLNMSHSTLVVVDDTEHHGGG